ncbi:centriole, cilia and spindle-associated protein [Neosynchiropus ocellatus]
MMSKKVRTEYMKRFREPKWETFSKCYEDSLKYRLTRRVMEHSHKPWFWEGWDGGSDSSGRSTPRPSRNKVVPLSLPRSSSSEGQQRLCELSATRPSDEPAVTSEDAAAPPEAVVDGNEVGGASDPPLVDATIDNGPVDSTSSDGEPANPRPKRRHRRRAPRSEPGRHDDKSGRKQRAKSQPPSCSRDAAWSAVRPDWTERHAAQVGLQNLLVPRHSDHSAALRRARSADLDKLHRSPLTASDDRWMTEYMRCFSARLR